MTVRGEEYLEEVVEDCEEEIIYPTAREGAADVDPRWALPCLPFFHPRSLSVDHLSITYLNDAIHVSLVIEVP